MPGLATLLNPFYRGFIPGYPFLKILIWKKSSNITTFGSSEKVGT